MYIWTNSPHRHSNETHLDVQSDRRSFTTFQPKQHTVRDRIGRTPYYTIEFLQNWCLIQLCKTFLSILRWIRFLLIFNIYQTTNFNCEPILGKNGNSARDSIYGINRPKYTFFLVNFGVFIFFLLLLNNIQLDWFAISR